MTVRGSRRNADTGYLHLLSSVEYSPIFIQGEHRSGTTILYKMLGLSGSFNGVDAYHVLRNYELLANYTQGREKQARAEVDAIFQSWNMGTRVIDEMPLDSRMPEEYGMHLLRVCHRPTISRKTLPAFDQFCRKIEYISDVTRKLLLKNPWDFSRFLYIKQVFPGAKFIFIHRNPIHILNSQLKTMQTTRAKGNPYVQFIADVPGLIPFLYRTRLLRMVKNWTVSPKNSLRLGLRLLARKGEKLRHAYRRDILKLPEESWLSIRYEDLCEQPNELIEEILAFAGVECARHLDYSRWTKPRPLVLLPEVQSWESHLRSRFRESMIYHGYS